MNKYQYVAREAQNDPGNHHCHWPGCETIVPPAHWGCKRHWFLLPLDIRNRIWAAYRPGQEIQKNPSAAYLKAANDADEWIKQYIADKKIVEDVNHFSKGLGMHQSSCPRKVRRRHEK